VNRFSDAIASGGSTFSSDDDPELAIVDGVNIT
jgi:hypothetical protein